MNVEEKEITSKSDPTDNRPWYDLSVSDGILTVDTDGDGGHNPDLTGDSIAVDNSANSVVAVAQDKGLITYVEGSNGVPPLRAHLAWYDAETDELTILEFTEEQ